MALLLDQTAGHLRSAGILRVTGPDRMTYLHSLLSQDLETASAGSVADFLYLDARGNVQAMGRAVVLAGAVLLVTPLAVAATLTESLQRYTFLLQAETENLTGQWALASIRGPVAADIVGARSEPMTVAPAGDGFVVRDRSGGVDLIGPGPWVEQRLADSAVPVTSEAEWDAWRITAGEAEWGKEVVEGRRAQELGLLPTHVHLRKGCYPGQESVAKIYNLGRPRRVLAVAEFAGPVAAGDPVDAGGKSGEVTSAAPSGAVWMALTLVPVDREGKLLGDGTLMVGNVPGRVRRMVGAEMAIPGA